MAVQNHLSMENDFLLGKTFFSTKGSTFKGNVKLCDLWFFNTSTKSRLKFFRDELYEAFEIKVFKNGAEITDTDDKIFGCWDMCLFEVFDSRFAVKRTASGFEIKYTPGYCYTKSDKKHHSFINPLIKNIDIIHTSANSQEEIEKTNPDGICKFIKLTNTKVKICSYKNQKETRCGRFILLYILAKAYYFRLEHYLRLISVVIDKRKSVGNRILNAMPVKLGFSELRKIEKLYTQYVLFKNNYLYSFPLQHSSVNELPDIWDNVYDFYRIKKLSDEVIEKINALTLLSRGRHSSIQSSYLFIFAVCGCIVSFIKIVELIFK